ncbi:uncharacterized protein [Dysidea avara]|uniref:uncharacterized protein n=1 Tax=Dysidea avara TaxID=196820 RepID=UPI0033325DB7
MLLRNALHIILPRVNGEHTRNLLEQSVCFFSFLMDGTTDVSKMEDKAVLMMYFKKDDFFKEIKSCTRYLSVANPSGTATDGLLQCLGEVLQHTMGIQDICDPSSILKVKPILVGGSTDGASVNISQHNSLRARLLESVPWIFWSWCYAHRLELSSKDGLNSQLFKNIDEMLLRLYYLYEKSSKKVRELKGIVEDLKEVYSFNDGGFIPVRSQGSRWITHKRRALQKVVDQYGAYIAHLTTLCEDKTLKSDDRACLKGTIQQRLEWSDLHLLRALIVFLESQSWVEREPADHRSKVGDPDVSLEEVKGALELLSSHF